MTIQATNNTSPVMSKAFLNDFVTGFFEKKSVFLDAVEKFGSPLYIVEPDILAERAGQFRSAFKEKLSRIRCYYAMKSNNLPFISQTLVKQGFGIDVSSGTELRTALDLKAKDIIFSGPGKTLGELTLALENPDQVTLLVDSFGELKKLKELTASKKTRLNIGVRINNNPEGLWRKFGIGLDRLEDFYREVSTSGTLNFCGLQFHSSWNLVPDRQTDFIKTLGNHLKKMAPEFIRALEFIDIGGGYWPSQGEWLLSDNPLVHFHEPAGRIQVFADQISRALKEHILNLTDCTICFEPGRWICNDAMHILIRVVDKKEKDLVITDAGTNTVGWERFETDYFPVLNLTNPGLAEKPCHILGALCTPHDVWGYAYFGENINEGDILMIPTQGAYTYSLRQAFIKPLPNVISIRHLKNSVSGVLFEPVSNRSIIDE